MVTGSRTTKTIESTSGVESIQMLLYAKIPVDGRKAHRVVMKEDADVLDLKLHKSKFSSYLTTMRI